MTAALLLFAALAADPQGPALPPPPVVFAPAAPPPATPPPAATPDAPRRVEASSPDHPALDLPKKREKPSTDTPVVIGLVTTGTIGLIGGTILGILASQDQSADAPNTQGALVFHQRSYTHFVQANTMAEAADGCFVGGGAFLLLGIIWALATGNGSSSDAGAKSGSPPGVRASWSF